MSVNGKKIVIVGKASVGKTCIVNSYTEDFFNENSTPTVGASFVMKSVFRDENEIQLLLWDTAGQEKYNSMTPLFYHGSTAAILVFALDDEESFKGIDFWHKSVQEHSSEIKMFMVGNKSDLVETRVIKMEDAVEKAKNLNIDYFETSAKTKAGIEDLFNAIVDYIVDKEKSLDMSSTEQVIQTISPEETQSKKSCC